MNVDPEGLSRWGDNTTTEDLEGNHYAIDREIYRRIDDAIRAGWSKDYILPVQIQEGNKTVDLEITIPASKMRSFKTASRYFATKYVEALGHKRIMDTYETTEFLSNGTAGIMLSGFLGWALAEYEVLGPIANGGKWLARRMFNRETLIKGAKAGGLSVGFNFSFETAIKMVVHHGDPQAALNDVDYGDVAVSFGTGYLTAPLETGKTVYDILNSGVLNVMDKYIKSKVGREKYEYGSKHARFDFVLGGLSRLIQQLHYDRAQASGEAKRLYKYLDHLQRSYRRLSAPRKLELKAAEQAAINYGKYFKVVLWQKGLKETTEKLLRPEQETSINDREVQP